MNYTLEKVEKLANVLRVYGDKDKYMLTVANKGTEVITVKIYKCRPVNCCTASQSR